MTVYDNWIRGTPELAGRIEDGSASQAGNARHHQSCSRVARQISTSSSTRLRSLLPSTIASIPLRRWTPTLMGSVTCWSMPSSRKNPASRFRAFCSIRPAKYMVIRRRRIFQLPETYRGHVSCTGPRACYDESKRYGETLCVNFAHQYDLPITMARPFNNYGPGLKISDRRVLPDFARDVFAGRDIVMLSDGSATRTFCYITDAIVGYYKILANGRKGRALQYRDRQAGSFDGPTCRERCRTGREALGLHRTRGEADQPGQGLSGR